MYGTWPTRCIRATHTGSALAVPLTIRLAPEVLYSVLDRVASPVVGDQGMAVAAEDGGWAG
jgi:hypothetical protein